MNFRQVRKKIKTISNVGKITKAMQMVASVKMKKSQQEALAGRAYREILEKIMRRLRGGIEDVGYKGKAEGSKNLYIFVSSNKGLCGSFNFGLFKKALKEADFKKSDFVTLGKKGADFILKMGGDIIADFSPQLPFIDNVSSVFSIVKNGFIDGKYANVYLFYNKFASTVKHEPVNLRLLPIVREGQMETKADQDSSIEYVIEPSFEEVLISLVEEGLKDKIRGAILDSEAAEHSSRMLAMKNATDAAGDIVYNLTLLRNKLRQSTITNELLDIVTATQSSQ